MIKKVILSLVIICIIISCGKKGDPEYKGPEKKVKMQNIFINNA